MSAGQGGADSDIDLMVVGKVAHGGTGRRERRARRADFEGKHLYADVTFDMQHGVDSGGHVAYGASLTGRAPM